MSERQRLVCLRTMCTINRSFSLASPSLIIHSLTVAEPMAGVTCRTQTTCDCKRPRQRRSAIMKQHPPKLSRLRSPLAAGTGEGALFVSTTPIRLEASRRSLQLSNPCSFLHVDQFFRKKKSNSSPLLYELAVSSLVFTNASYTTVQLRFHFVS